jgi:glycine/serine hydroxymethyltransferase
MTIHRLIGLLSQQERRYQNALHFVPSETALSPLARLPFITDAYGRYFFNDQRESNKWSFHGGRDLGEVEREILFPLLLDLGKAKYANVRPISGMNCLTIAMAALTELGDTVVAVDIDVGGHMSTPHVAQRLGLKLDYIPMLSEFEVDLEQLAKYLKKKQPALIYFDQSTLLFPIDIKPIKNLVTKYSPKTLIHFDASHLNGLILNGALPNPLDQGADSFGGSTHKTLPGPHKAFLLTNNPKIAKRIDYMGDHLVSHAHSAEILSLTITLLELKYCGGAEYAATVMNNAKAFAQHLHNQGVTVAAASRGFTNCHQVWVTPETDDPWALSERLYRCNLLVNNFPGLPGINRHSLRLSLAEITRFGMKPSDMPRLAELFVDAFQPDVSEDKLLASVQEIRSEFSSLQYCYTLSDLCNSYELPFLVKKYLEMWEQISR